MWSVPITAPAVAVSASTATTSSTPRTGRASVTLRESPELPTAPGVELRDVRREVRQRDVAVLGHERVDLEPGAGVHVLRTRHRRDVAVTAPAPFLLQQSLGAETRHHGHHRGVRTLLSRARVERVAHGVHGRLTRGPDLF